MVVSRLFAVMFIGIAIAQDPASDWYATKLNHVFLLKLLLIKGWVMRKDQLQALELPVFILTCDIISYSFIELILF
jgi:hypothetical protein